jgi:phosphatidylglycerol:prolipoprotein diacylglycerol transferase
VARWGCFFSGCCWGKPTDLPWAVTYPPLARQLHAGLPAVPVHPTQIYLSLNSLAIFLILVVIYRGKRFHGQIIMTYLMLYSVSRFFIEFVRGDAGRGFVFGGLLSTSQFIGIILLVVAVAFYLVLARKARRRG